VVFQLHPSFPQPTRELTEPPFEVTETGWGEFEASIRIVWKEIADERSTILTHGIRLYPNKAPATSADPSAYMNTSVPGERRRMEGIHMYIYIHIYIAVSLFDESGEKTFRFIQYLSYMHVFTFDVSYFCLVVVF